MSRNGQVSFKIPGKTFLLGEYLALYGGPSLVLATSPFFEIICTPGIGKNPFHKNSPAGLYIHEHQDFFSGWNIEFNDPYKTGGFGASTAQFIAVVLLCRHGRDLARENFFSTKKEMAIEVWDVYRELFANKKNKPSGADLIAQMAGEISVFDGRSKHHESWPWPWADKNVLLFKTPQKVATHDHLESVALDSEKLENELRPIAENAVAALTIGDWGAWMKSQELYAQILTAQGLVHADTRLLLEKISKIEGVLAARGCGALGADVIAVFTTAGKDNAVVGELKELNFMASLLNSQSYGPIIEVSNLSEKAFGLGEGDC